MTRMIPMRVISLFGLLMAAARPSGIDSIFQAVKADTALVYESQALDEGVFWSPDSSRLALNSEGKWFSITPGANTYALSKWRGGAIAVPTRDAVVTPITADEAAAWRKSTLAAIRKLRIPSGVEIELRQEEISTQFIIRRPGQKEKLLWSSDTENCYQPSLSPDQRYVAFLCELNGAMIFDLGSLKD